MKRLFLVAMTLAVAACATMPAANAPTAPIAAQAGTVILSAERGFAVAELAYTTAADGVGNLVTAGMIHGATATRVRGWNAEARALLVKGKATGDAAEKARAAVALFALADNLDAINGSK